MLSRQSVILVNQKEKAERAHVPTTGTMVDLMVVSFLWIPINAPMRMMTAKTDETI